MFKIAHYFIVWVLIFSAKSDIVKGCQSMKFKKTDKTEDKNMKGYSALSILEREIYSKSSDYKSQFTNRSILEIAIYNPTVQAKEGIWASIKRKTKKAVQKEY